MRKTDNNYGYWGRHNKLLKVPGEKEKAESGKCKYVICANGDMEKIKSICCVLKGENSTVVDMSPLVIRSFT